MSERYYSVTVWHDTAGQHHLRVERSYGQQEYADTNARGWQEHFERNGMAATGTRQVVVTQEQMDAYRELGELGLGLVL